MVSSGIFRNAPSVKRRCIEVIFLVNVIQCYQFNGKSNVSIDDTLICLGLIYGVRALRLCCYYCVPSGLTNRGTVVRPITSIPPAICTLRGNSLPVNCRPSEVPTREPAGRFLMTCSKVPKDQREHLFLLG